MIGVKALIDHYNQLKNHIIKEWFFFLSGSQYIIISKLTYFIIYTYIYIYIATIWKANCYFIKKRGSNYLLSSRWDKTKKKSRK
jgi:hypothetical protein